MDPLSGVQTGLSGSLKKLQDEFSASSIAGDKKSADSAEVPDFGSLLGKGIQDVVDLQRESGAKKRGLVTGETQNIHEVMIAGEKAGVAFEMMLQVRNKLLAAWKEVTRLQV
jgi:flagellar hook-basal body complex protein FliE